MRPSVLGLAVVVLATVVITLRTLHALSFGSDSAPTSTHVVLCSDSAELRPLYIAIKSTLSHVRNSGVLQFHVVTSPQLETIYSEILRRMLPGVKLEIHTNPRLLGKIRRYITYRSSSKVEQEMANLFRFVPFFLPEFLGRISYGDVPRLIYLDTDTVVLGDVVALAGIQLRGHPVAAPRDCSVELRQIIDFSLVKQFQPDLSLHPMDCPLSRGIMVIDPKKWQFLNVSGKFLQWLERYRDQPLLEDLWADRLDIPPLMLSLNGFRPLTGHWSCVNLGQEELPPSSTKELLQLGFAHQDLQSMARTVGPTGSVKPPLHPCTATAHLLHFGGPLKPWLDTESVQAMCVLPQAVAPTPEGWTKLDDPGYTFDCKVKGGSIRLVNCSMLWRVFLTEEEDCALKGYEQWPTQPRTLPPTSPAPTLKAETTVQDLRTSTSSKSLKP